LTQQLGAEMPQWTWGRLHTMTAKHALGVKKPLDEIFDVGKQAIGGDTDTLCQIHLYLVNSTEGLWLVLHIDK